jgi:hypothetical protein
MKGFEYFRDIFFQDIHITKYTQKLSKADLKY